jgi:hypothetical protein
MKTLAKILMVVSVVSALQVQAFACDEAAKASGRVVKGDVPTGDPQNAAKPEQHKSADKAKEAGSGK